MNNVHFLPDIRGGSADEPTGPFRPPRRSDLNITRAAEIDPWPRYGLVAKYKPFILNRIKPLLENNRHLNRNEVITDAIRITWEASQKFKQELGYDFSTYLRHLLPNRLYDLYGIEKSKKDEEEPDILETEPLQFLAGGNGARLVLDTGVLSLGLRVAGNDLNSLLGTLERLRDNTAVVPCHHENAQAYLRAIVDHTERREREAKAEAEQGGVVLLEAQDLQADIRLFKDNRLLRFKPQLAIEDRLGESPCQDIGSYQVIPAPQSTRTKLKRSSRRRNKPQVYTKPDGNGFDELAWELDQYIAHADLNDLEKIALAFMRTNSRTPDYKLAELLGVSQGHYSKLKVKIEEKMRAGRKKWRAANGLPEFDEPCLECNQNYPAHRHFYGDEND